MRATAVFSLTLAFAGAFPAYSQPSFSENDLRTYLRKYVSRPVFDIDKNARYSFASVQLRPPSQPKSVLVYLKDNNFCGSGGCRLLILEPQGKSFREIGLVSISRPPVRVLAHATKGWKDIAVSVCGGGFTDCYEAALPFNGKGYASNPTAPPAHQIKRDAPGETVIREGEGKPLY